MHKDTKDKLDAAIHRLMNENAQLRRKMEEAEIVIRRRAPNADGLSPAAAVNTILDDRDEARGRTLVFREEMKKILLMLLEDRTDEAKKQLNLFLFNNPR